MLVKLADLDIAVWKALTDLYKRDPLPPHCYTIYDMLYQLESMDLRARICEGTLQSYLLVWIRGSDHYCLHVWNTDLELLSTVEIPHGARAVVQLYNEEPGDAERVMDCVAGMGCGNIEKRSFHDMVCDYKSFKPSSNETLTVKLDPEHAELLLDLRTSTGKKASLEETVELLRSRTFYGIIIDGLLVSTASLCVRLPEIYVVSDVLTRPEYRGRGYAKAVVSAVTRKAVESGAVAVLHVEALNEPAIRVYKSLGYGIVRTRSWLIASR